MNPFILSPKERLADWKGFRESLKALPERDQLDAVARYWALAPLLSHAHYPDVEKVPTPWEMISEGNWCRNSVAIGMEFTLRLAGWKAERLELQMIRDYDLSEIIMVLIIDGQSVLNYNYGEIADYPKTRHDITDSWVFSGKLYTRSRG